MGQSGLRAIHTARPGSTIRWQKSLDSSGGRVGRSCSSTLAGSLVPSVRPSRPVMRMQWVSATTTPVRDRANQFSEQYQHNYSVLATPAEGLSGKFTRIDRKKFGTLPGITDRDYYIESTEW